jgi:hypothetical protein
MRVSRIGVCVGLLPLAATLFGGCFNFSSDCDYFLCPPGSGTDGGVQTGCDPSKSAGPVADSCGVFVSNSGDDGNAGTKEKPLKTITAALGKGTTVYACAGAMPFSEAVTVSKSVTLFGGMDCATWAYDATNKTQLTAAADAVPLTLASTAGGSEVHDFAITAADAMTAGGSSIAMIAEVASVELEAVSVTAGVGAKGADGMGQVQVVTPAGATGQPGGDDMACNMTGVFGGAGGTNTCGGTDTSGGAGGDGLAATSGNPGGGGNPMMTPGNGGAGQDASSCKPGGVGADGSIGTPGTGARGIGDVSAAGYIGATGTLGGVGTPGQGGGGGGGALACDPLDMPPKFAGPSGGGGGAGGCPGAPGSAAQSGGSSIGILSLGAALTLNTVSIATHDGGAGGTGGDGQPGGNGGQPGNAGGGASCGGGKGGQGGAGGPGGGGAGGHSVAVIINAGGTLPDLSSTTIVPGMGGAGGPGGNMDMTMQTKGDDGMACTTLDFAKPTGSACGM